MTKRAQIQLVRARVVPIGLPKFDHDAIRYVCRIDGHRVRVVHWSGKFNGPVNQLAAELRRLALTMNADLITTTESQQRGVRKVVKRAFGKKWGVKKTGEYLCIFRKAKFANIRKPHVKIRTAIANWPKWRQMHVGYFNLRHRATKRRLRLMVVHGPSGIQSGSRFRPGRQSAIAQQGWPKLGRNMRRFERTHPRAVQAVHADCNANLRDPHWLAWFESQLGATCVYRVNLPKRGSHGGGRLIEGAWIKNAKG